MAATIVIGTITSGCVDGGDPEELQTRLRNYFLTQGADFLADIALAGTGDGPRWLCQVTTTDDSNTATLAAFNTLTVFAVTGGNPEELQTRIFEKLSSIANKNYVVIQAAGASAGRLYMAVIVVQPLEA